MSSSAKGWMGPWALGLGSALSAAPAMIKSAWVVIFRLVASPSTTWTAWPAASMSCASSVMSGPSSLRRAYASVSQSRRKAGARLA